MERQWAEPGKYNFGPNDWLTQALDICQKRGAKVILCAGLKTPRDPEFHPPGWLKIPDRGSIGKDNDEVAKTTLRWITELIKRYKDHPAIIAWQVENEPTTATRSINRGLLETEVSTVRKFDTKKRPIVLTSWTAVDIQPNHQELFLGLKPVGPAELPLILMFFGTSLEDLVKFQDLLKWGDWVGLDVYAKSENWQSSEEQFKIIQRAGQKIKKAGKRFVVSELQAEPWEGAGPMDFDNPHGNRSLNPKSYRTLLDRVTKWKPDEIWLWGLEFQLTCQKRGNSAWIDETKRILSGRSQ